MNGKSTKEIKNANMHKQHSVAFPEVPNNPAPFLEELIRRKEDKCKKKKKGEKTQKSEPKD